jgi:hypothetical protein
MARARSVCNEPDCPNITSYRGRCVTHARKVEQERGTRQERGYGPDHQAARRWWTAEIAAGRGWCARCRQPIPPGTPFDLGHTDDRTGWTGAECVTCNRSAGGQAAHRNGQ